jgi:hypothetical protein
MQITNLENFHRRERFFSLIDRMKAKPWHCIVLSLVMILGDYLTGSRIQFPFLYIIPVSLAAWGGNTTLAYLLAILLPATRILMAWLWNVDLGLLDVIINVLIRIVVLAGLVYLLVSLQSVRLLRGILHTCGYCHRIETAKGEWKSIEQFMAEYSEAMLSHGVCPECATKYWGSLSKVVTKRKSQT